MRLSIVFLIGTWYIHSLVLIFLLIVSDSSDFIDYR